MERLTVGSLFSGIGGFDLGLERAGHRIRWQVEIDESCRSVLQRRMGADPSHGLYGDIRTVRGLATVDLVCGGFPCQDLSVAGKRAGLAGARSGLWHEFHRVIAELTPRWVLIENVPGLLSSNEGRDMGVIVYGLAELGYGWAYRVLDAQYFGVAQRRRRVFIVGCLGDSARAAAVLFEPESCDGDSPPRRSTREGAAASLTSGSGVGSNDPGRRREDDVNLVASALGSITGGQRQDLDGMTYLPEIAWALQERDAKGSDSSTKDGHLLVTHTLRSEGGDASEDGTGRGTPLVVGGGSYPTVTDLAPPLTTRHADQTSVNVRRLTPTECERLQGFPDGWTAGQSNSVRYRQLGNAVCVPVAEWIGRRMVAYHTPAAEAATAG